MIVPRAPQMILADEAATGAFGTALARQIERGDS